MVIHIDRDLKSGLSLKRMDNISCYDILLATFLGLKDHKCVTFCLFGWNEKVEPYIIPIFVTMALLLYVFQNLWESRGSLNALI